MNVVITGASRGLGLAIAEKFAMEGHQLYLSARNKKNLESSAEELKKKFSSSKIKYHAADLSVKEETIAFGDWIAEQQIDIDVLVNNAGSFLPGNVHDEAAGTLEEMISVNLYSAYHLTRKLLPAMMQRKSGHIFTLCSIASLKAYPNGGAYSVSKFALLGMTKNLREEMRPHNIKVTAIIPGAVYTDSWAASGVKPERLMKATDIAELVYATSQLSPQACVEEIVIRPQAGDL
jgi:short-subunit dehydrogenase